MRAAWEHLAWVDSLSHPGEPHAIKRNSATGAIGCTCKKFIFSKARPRTCHHLEAWRHGEARLADRPVVMHEGARLAQEVQVGDERMVVRRSIRFRGGAA